MGYRRQHDEETMSMRPEIVQLPTDLNEDSVAKHLTMVSRRNPEQLPGVVTTIRERWAHNRARWVEEGRSAYLETVLKQLKISNEILRQCVEQCDLLADHHRRRDGERAEREHHIADLEAQAKAEELQARIEASKAQAAESRGKRAALENPSVPKSEPSAEQRRQENLKRAEEKIASLRQRKGERLAEILQGRSFEHLSPDEQDEYHADENMYTDRIQRAREELAKLI